MAAQDKRFSHYAKGRTNYPTGLINSRKPNNSRTRQIISLPTHQLTYSSNLSTQKLRNSRTHQPINSPAHNLDNSPTRQLINSSTYQLVNLSTRQLINSKA